MTQEEFVKKNIDLHQEFLEYVEEHPETLDEIPEGAHVVFLPEDDEIFSEENLVLARRLQEENPQDVFLAVRLRRLEQPAHTHVPISLQPFQAVRAPAF